MSTGISLVQLAGHTLTARVYIPEHVYKHPAALHLERCSTAREVLRILPLIYKHSLYREHLFQTKLVSLFADFGCLEEAHRVFQSVEGTKPDVLYYTMLKSLTRYSSLESALWFFCKMREDDIRLVVYNYIYLLKHCVNESHLRNGKELHSQLVVNGFCSNIFAMTAVMNMYGKCKEPEDAYKLFEKMPTRDLVCWNTIISSLVQNDVFDAAMAIVPKMYDEHHLPDSITVLSLLSAAAQSKYLRVGMAIHGFALRNRYAAAVNVSSALVDMYAKCGFLESARVIFDGMDEKNVVSWNSLIGGYVGSENPQEALLLFKNMMGKGLQPSNVTIMEALHASAESGNLEEGEQIHKLSDKMGFQSDVSISNSLISMYSKCKRIKTAASVFESLPNKTRVSWNAMILGYAQNGYAKEAINLFHAMHALAVEPDSFTFVSLITAIAEFSIPRQAKWVHGLVIRRSLDGNVFVQTALVDMYAKCGSLPTARKLFDEMADRHVITWNTMIDGYGVHGHGKEAVQLFNDMDIKPNEITFLCVISACSHSGMVEEGKRIFETLVNDNIVPTMDHYGAMVDLLGRAGRIRDAWDFMNEMPVEPSISVYGALLGACKIHKRVEMGEEVARRIFEKNPEDGGYHVLLTNLYAGASRWDDVARVRKMMEESGLRKTPGWSVVECGKKVERFYSGDTCHPESKRIYAYWEELAGRLKAAGYVVDTNSVHDVEEDVKEQMVSGHSEKLAIAYALLTTAEGTPIHVRKNLRVCGDCHNATKYISLVTGREIVVRDMHRFHHFKDGVCSCADYW